MGTLAIFSINGQSIRRNFMSILLQITIGIGVGAMLFFVPTFFVKKGRMVFVMTAIILGVTSGLVFTGGRHFFKSETEEKTEIQAKGEDYFILARELTDLEAFDGAMEVLDEYLEYFPYNAQYVSACEYLYHAMGDDTAETAMQSVSAGMDKKVEKIKSDPTIRKIAESYVKGQQYTDGDVVSENEYREIYSDMKSCVKKRPQLVDIHFINRYLITMQINSGEYRAVISNMGNFEDSQEVLAAAELYLRKVVTDEEFENNRYLVEQKERLNEALNWILKQNEQYSYEGNTAELVNRTIEDLRNAVENNVYDMWMKQQLLEQADEDLSYASKLYMEVSKYAFHKEDYDGAKNYLDEALNTAPYSTEDDYRQAAGAIVDVLTTEDTGEALKKIDEYAKKWIAAQSPMNITKVQDSEDDTEEESNEGEESSTEENVSGEDFSQFVSDTQSQKTASMNIVSIDTSDFETVKAIVAVDENIATTESELKNKIALYDCGCQIDNYTVKKQNYSTVNIILVCDNSGSMGDYDKIQNLRDAVTTFIDGADVNTNIAIVPFEDGVGNVAELGTKKDELINMANNMNAGGGTNIYAGISCALEMFPANHNALNIMVVMSDGQDAEPNQEMRSEISYMCRDKDITIYSMGLGEDVDAAIMSSYSGLGGGQYVYVSDSGSLANFYEYIDKLSRNRYEVTFTAADTIKEKRILEMEDKTNLLSNTSKDYYLYQSELSEDDLGDSYSVSLDGIVISGFDSRLLYQSSGEQQIHLMGSGFQKEKEISVKIKAGIEYELTCKYESESQYLVTVPAKVACDVYDVYVTVDGRRAVLADGLVVTSKNLNVIKYGDYVFTSTFVEKEGNTTTLKGYIMMNNWLGFQKYVTLTGNLTEDSEIQMESGQAYVQYYTGDSLGLASYMAKHGYYFNSPQIMTGVLYKNEGVSADSDEYQVAKIPSIKQCVLFDVFKLRDTGTTVALYPDKMEIDFQGFSTEFPCQDKLLKAVDYEELFNFTLDHSEKMIVTKNRIDLNLEVELGNPSEDFRPANLGNMRLNVNGDSIGLKLDTVKGDISLKAMVNIAMLSHGSDKSSGGIGAEITWSDWTWDGLTLFADKNINTYIANIPVTFSDFSLGVEGVSSAIKDKKITNLSQAILKGKFMVSMAKISAVYPGLEKWTGDAAVASLKDVEVSFKLSDMAIGVKATANLLGIVDIGKADIRLGMRLPYTNELLDMHDEEVGGFVGKITVGPEVHTNNLDLTTTVGGELALTSKVLGGTGEGDVFIDVHWWVFSVRAKASGTAFIGWYQQHNGEWVFAIRSHGMSNPIVWGSHGAVRSSKSL